LNAWARRAIHASLSRIHRGRLQLHDENRLYCFGESTTQGMVANVRVVDPQFYSALMWGGSLGAAESYLRGDWQTDDLLPLFRLFSQNQAALQVVDRKMAWAMKPLTWSLQWWNRNTLAGSRRNIHAHYDLGNEFFRLFLDETMTYSSAIFASPDQTLADASQNKYRRICERLGLKQGMRVVEIGTGWGGFAIYAAQQFGCQVTTTTISAEQHAYASARIAELGLTDQIELLQLDYRLLQGTYDRLVSIEMIEAVGHEYLPTYFQKCASLLRADGEMMLQAITIPDQRFDQYRRSIDFIQRYIFPGGALPSLGSIARAVATTERLQLLQWEDFSPHYAETLSQWRMAFWREIEAVRRLGLDDRFVRMWDYYLAYCEAGFRERMTGLVQLHLRNG
jgi:cyclopropane-fatty-acyl-phospholipid synthase